MNETEVKKGLVGVLADVSAVSKVMPETNSLTYRGYAVQDLAEHCCFEEVAYLLWYGELPTHAQLDYFRRQERMARPISDAQLRAIREFPDNAHPMDAIRTAVSFMGMRDPESADNSREAMLRKGTRLLGKIPTAIAAAHRLSKGKEPISPDPNLSFSENFFHVVFGQVPPPALVKAFDASLILYAEHGFNASTFTARCVMSTGGDLHGAVTAGIAALKGPLHGGANEAVMHMLREIGSAERARDWLHGKFAAKEVVMGFGHRVYKHGDSRVPTMTKFMEAVAEETGGAHWLQILRVLETEMVKEKGIYPNLDFPTGPAYFMMGFDVPLFTPIFVAARVTGWTAHAIEQAEDNRLIRPLSVYTGVPQRQVIPIAKR